MQIYSRMMQVPMIKRTQILQTMVWLLNFTYANMVLRLSMITNEAHTPLHSTFPSQRPPLVLWDQPNRDCTS